MSTKPINDGGPAFPLKIEDGQGGYEQCYGMSLRDWFAGQALAGYTAAPDERKCPAGHSNPDLWQRDILAQDAAWCYKMADAMLAAREVSNQREK